ncbi:MAG: glycosyltransferase family 4 protein [Planctomycetes bacterium]|nr:glycosyltransferase family 4 protein [Planctomycetota bacterium]
MNGVTDPSPRVALVAIGIGTTQRGYERYFSDLYRTVRDDLDITLFSGAEGPHCRVPSSYARYRRIARLLPLGLRAQAAEDRHYRQDCLAYAWALAGELARGRYDIVHVIDYFLAGYLRPLLRRRVPGARLIYTNGCCVPPPLCPKADLIHHVAEPLYKAAVAQAGEGRTRLVPCGLEPRRFRSPLDRRELRRKHGIGQDARVVLAVTAIKRPHKRADYIIDEFARAGGQDVILWMDGRHDEPDLVEHARRTLGPRFRATHVPSDEVGELYSLADLFVHAALEESFGLSIVEAMSCGLPILVHDSPHFQWLTGGREHLVDMSRPGALSARLEQWLADPAGVPAADEPRWRRFDWQVLKDQYLAMYRSLTA